MCRKLQTSPLSHSVGYLHICEYTQSSLPYVYEFLLSHESGRSLPYDLMGLCRQFCISVLKHLIYCITYVLCIERENVKGLRRFSSEPIGQ
jgi:hypothetical protein